MYMIYRLTPCWLKVVAMSSSTGEGKTSPSNQVMKFSMAPVAKVFEKQLGKPVTFLSSCALLRSPAALPRRPLHGAWQPKMHFSSRTCIFPVMRPEVLARLLRGGSRSRLRKPGARVIRRTYFGPVQHRWYSKRSPRGIG